jgi:hypothetical protein
VDARPGVWSSPQPRRPVPRRRILQTAIENAHTDNLDWEPRTHDGKSFEVVNIPMERLVRCERSGTFIYLTSEYDMTTMLDVAASIAPAPTEPPRLTG